jgi:phosphoglycolate phosphatase
VLVANSRLPWARSDFDAAIVDLDGTMVHTLADFVVALQQVLDELPAPYAQYTVRAEVVEPMVGKGSENLVKSMLAHVEYAQAATKNVAPVGQNLLTPASAESLFELAWAAYQRHYAACNGQHARVYDGVLQGLRQFKAQGWSLACVTNKPTAFAKELLEQKGLLDFFDHTLGGDAVARKKPDPLPLLTGCQLLGTQPARTLMVGDSSNDAAAARAAGCPVLLVSYGYNHGVPVNTVDADALTDSLATLRWRA